MKRIVLLALPLVLLAGCGGKSSTATRPAATTGPTSAAVVDANATYPDCATLVGHVLTVADETGICMDAGAFQPASATKCNNGQTYIIVAPNVAGLLGKPALKTK